MTADFLVEVDKLVQLVESPIFTCELTLVFNISCYLTYECLDM